MKFDYNVKLLEALHIPKHAREKTPYFFKMITYPLKFRTPNIVTCYDLTNYDLQQEASGSWIVPEISKTPRIVKHIH